MSLRLIYGRAGTGKSEYCFKDIKNSILQEKCPQMRQNVAERTVPNATIITPEQFSYTAEKKLLDNLRERCSY